MPIAATPPILVALMALVPLVLVVLVAMWVYAHRDEDAEWRRR